MEPRLSECQNVRQSTFTSLQVVDADCRYPTVFCGDGHKYGGGRRREEGLEEVGSKGTRMYVRRECQSDVSSLARHVKSVRGVVTSSHSFRFDKRGINTIARVGS